MPESDHKLVLHLINGLQASTVATLVPAPSTKVQFNQPAEYLVNCTHHHHRIAIADIGSDTTSLYRARAVRRDWFWLKWLVLAQQCYGNFTACHLHQSTLFIQTAQCPFGGQLLKFADDFPTTTLRKLVPYFSKAHSERPAGFLERHRQKEYRDKVGKAVWVIKDGVLCGHHKFTRRQVLAFQFRRLGLKAASDSQYHKDKLLRLLTDYICHHEMPAIFYQGQFGGLTAKKATSRSFIDEAFHGPPSQRLFNKAHYLEPESAITPVLALGPCPPIYIAGYCWPTNGSDRN